MISPKRLPSISIITLTLNPSLSIWKQTLDSIKWQQYPKQKIEHLVMDGGSNSGTINLTKKYSCQVKFLPRLKDRSEVRKGVGINLAKGELIAFIEADNPLTEKTWILKMVEPFMAEPQAVGAFSIHNDYTPGMPVLTRYCALFGVNDPLVYYLNKSEKLPRFKKYYDMGEVLRETSDYYVVRFDRETLPTLGDNGHIVRRSLIQKVNKNPEKFIHVDAFAQLLELKYDTYAAVKNSIIHYTGSNILKLFRRRTTYKERFYNERKKERSYFVFDSHSPKDRWNLFRFIIFSLTFIEPLFQSLRGYMVVREPAWFLHPIVCFVAVLSYTQSELGTQIAQAKSKLKKLFLFL